jgi:hypothetical protein
MAVKLWYVLVHAYMDECLGLWFELIIYPSDFPSHPAKSLAENLEPTNFVVNVGAVRVRGKTWGRDVPSCKHIVIFPR